MRKGLLVKSVALVVCLIFIGISASGLFAAEKKASGIEVRRLMKRSVDFMTSIFPVFNGFFKFDQEQVLSIDTSSANIVKPTNEDTGGRPNRGD